ncbi:imidazole glycerol phosphate synthase [candidate division MSBL1 archaeon SCGC-AAA259I09]|uniref:Imidazole glycerol phosphate synthase subunit HisF n=4 Tax=candidate division MSBL1 TaxID=215777 RepID=A0A133UUJ8_9EURY|nr:imidazole glycerol phosphate synthase [candidate division MSBL1 archaeon SCGC-AAA259I14]KXA97975.1 imidazole glycerol phosphate synthase [candidate division MSBL1 archaeon SCGC-AAA259I09]
MVKRIIPCLDTREGKLVKGVHFKDIKEIGDPVEYARKYEGQGADELVFLDISATPEGKSTFVEAVERVSEQISIPLTVGGGIRKVEDAEDVFDAGASKVSVNTAAVKNPKLINELSKQFGTDSVVSAIDGKKRSEREWEVYISGGRKSTGIDMLEWAETVEKEGAGEILYTGLHTDGTKEGYDLKGLRTLAETVDLPIIASGGAGNLEHIKDALTEGKADAALAASIFHYGEYSVKEVKEYLRDQGISVRL